MKVLMLTCNNSLQDGINRHILAVAPAVNLLEGLEVAVCTTFGRGEINEALERQGVKTYALGLPHGHDLRTWIRFRKVMREFRPDVVHCHVLGLFQRYYLDLFYPQLPRVYTCHGINDIESGVRKIGFRDRLDGWVGRFRPAAFWRKRGKCTTIYISEGVRRHKNAKGAVIYNPIAFDAANAVKDANVLRTELGLARDAKVIGTACRISLPKRPQLFVATMCKVMQRLADVHAVVCGTSNDAALMSDLRRIVSESGVAARFHWLGYRADAPQIAKELDCFVMTSATEGMPTALLEAMAVKTPIAFMRGKGGLVDLDEFDKSEGPIAAVADAGDVDGLADKIYALLNNSPQAQANAERAFACGARHFDVAKIADQLARICHIIQNLG